jgi:tripartite-type tricarboxylate transporter receptor subunit TctC
MMKAIAAAICGALLACQGVTAARAADYPTQPITLIVPFAAGGPTDVVARLLGESMSQSLGQPIVIENVVGAGGTTAATRAMRSPSDGYTIIMGHMGTHAAAVALYPKLAYNPSTDFEPIGLAALMPVLLLAKQDIGARDLKEFIAYAKQHEAQLTMAHAGVGSVSYVTCIMFNSLVGLKPKMVAFQGTAPAINALVAGRVDYMCDQVVSGVPRIKAGSIRAYVVGTTARNPVLPDVPTSEEAGLPEFQASAWNALFAPKGTPQAVVDKLNSALGKALDDETVRSSLLALGSDIPDRDKRSPQALSQLVKSEIAKWTPVLGKSGG